MLDEFWFYRVDWPVLRSIAVEPSPNGPTQRRRDGPRTPRHDGRRPATWSGHWIRCGTPAPLASAEVERAKTTRHGADPHTPPARFEQQAPSRDHRVSFSGDSPAVPKCRSRPEREGIDFARPAPRCTAPHTCPRVTAKELTRGSPGTPGLL